MDKALLTEKCLWEKLKGEKRPIYLYGTGNGADKILKVCEKFGITVAGVFASSDFVRSRTYMGMHVQSLESVEAACGDDFVVLLAFGTSLPSVAETIEKTAKKHTLYIPEVPLYGGDLFDREYYNRHIRQIEEAEMLFSDSESVQLYGEMIKFRLTGDPKLLKRTVSPENMYSAHIRADKVHRAVDCGAYKGDSARDIFSALQPDEIIALEPDPKTFKKLEAAARSELSYKLVPLNLAVGSENGTSCFSASGSRGSGISGKNRRSDSAVITTAAIDSLELQPFQLLKLDVEGDEAKALFGAEKSIVAYRPALAVSVYHRTEDIFTLPAYIHSLCPDYKLYLRRAPCIPAWDTVLMCVPPELS